MTSSAAALVDLGSTVYSRTRRHAAGDEAPIGGVVVGSDQRPVLDEDGLRTGEAMVVYEVLDPHEHDLNRAFHYLDADDIDHGTVEGPTHYHSRLRKLVCRLDAGVAHQKGKAFDSRHGHWQAVAGLLMGIVAGAQP